MVFDPTEGRVGRFDFFLQNVSMVYVRMPKTKKCGAFFTVKDKWSATWSAWNYENCGRGIKRKRKLKAWIFCRGCLHSPTAVFQIQWGKLLTIQQQLYIATIQGEVIHVTGKELGGIALLVELEVDLLIQLFLKITAGRVLHCYRLDDGRTSFGAGRGGHPHCQLQLGG